MVNKLHPQQRDAARARAARRRRGGERGATIFLVTLVAAMLTAMGVFAARAASLNESSSGFDRSNEQAHFVMQHGMALTASLCGRQPLLCQQANNDCWANYYATWAGGQKPKCRSLTADKLASYVSQAQTQGGQPQKPIFDLANAGAPQPDAFLNTPGSLGYAAVAPRFLMEVTDSSLAFEQPAGTQVAGGGQQFKYNQAVIAMWGDVWPFLNTAACDAPARIAALSVTREAGRAYMLYGPLPGN